MARTGALILEDDEEMDILSFMLEACSINSRDFFFNERIFTKEIFEKNYKVLEKMVGVRNFRRAPYFVLGYLALITGAKISDKMREEILEATRWEHEKDYWSSSDQDFIVDRKICIEDFQDKIRLHRPRQQLHPIVLKHSDKDFKNGLVVIGLNQFKEFCNSRKIQNVNHINLDGFALKEIPEEIFKLQNLRELSLEFNQISQISDKISNLKSLKYLYLSYNQLTAIPEKIEKLELVKSLNFDNNYILALPESLKQLKNLKYLYIRGNKIKKIPASLKKASFKIEYDFPCYNPSNLFKSI